MRFRCWSLCLTCVVSAAAVAADADPPPRGWTGKGQAGLLVSQGNSDAKSANAALDLTRESDPWKHTLHAAALYGQVDGITSAQRWDAAWQTNYQFSPRMFTFGALRYARDHYSGFNYQASVSAGFGYKFIDEDTSKLSLQLGAGYRQQRPELITKDAVGRVIDRELLPLDREAVGTVGLDYLQKLTESTALTNKLLVEYGSSNTSLTDNLALQVKMSDKLALSLGLSLVHNSDPPDGLRHTDTVETVNLVYAF